MSEQMFEDVVQTNLYGVFNIMRAALPSMIDNGFGRIVTTSSMAGRMGYANAGHYCASKWDLIGLTKAIALERRRPGRKTPPPAAERRSGRSVALPRLRIVRALDPKQFERVFRRWGSARSLATFSD